MHHKLNLVADFKCLGSDCPMTCCQSWDIRVDDETMQRWLGLEDQELKGELLESYRDAETPEGQKQQIMKLNSKTRTCVQINKDGLCSIQLALGHEYLPRICREYPRINRRESSRTIESANLSCPAVTVPVLQSENIDSLFTYSSNHSLSSNQNEEFNNELEQFVSQVLSDKRVGCHIQLYVIANAICELVIASQQGCLDWNKLKQITGKARQKVYDVNQKVKSRRIAIDKGLAGRFWMLVYNWSKLFSDDGLFGEFSQHEFIRLTSTADDSEEFYEKFYQALLELSDSTKDRLSSPGNFGARYLRVKFVNNGFPMSPLLGNYVASFLYCVYPYALIKLYLMLLASEKEEILPEDVNNIICRVERKLDHNIKIYEILGKNTLFLRLDVYKECLIDV